jgi:hypothetical protein
MMDVVLILATVFLCADADTGPGGRNKPGFVYDSDRKTFVLFGGFGKRGEGTRGDTWEWDGAHWTRAATSGPSARGALSMAYDAKRKRVILYGGSGPSAQFDDTWEWDGKLWKQIATAGPPARGGMQMAYDSRRHKIVGFGGYDQASRQPLGETWEWSSNGTWRQVSSSGPPARTNHFLTYDSRHGKTVLYGGNRASGPAEDRMLGDTWEWDGAQWLKVAESASIPKRDHHGMSYDQARGRVVLFGGWNGQYLGDTWEWDGAKWSAVNVTGPSPRGGIPSLAYDTHRKNVVLFGGWDATGPVADVWAFDGKSWRQLAQ